VKLLPDWREIIRDAWSIRLIIIAGILSGLEVAIALTGPALFGIRPGTFAALSGLVTMAAFVARLIAQKENDDG
jgi:hypothetical protein